MAVAGAPWQLECENVEQRCGYLLTSGQWSDCAFMVGSTRTNQEVVQAHQLVLAMASPVFEAMFYGGLSERNDPIVTIPDVQPEAFRTLLQYIYTGNINIGSLDMAWDLWYGAKKYMLPHLEKMCNSYIYSVVGPKNACRAYEFARLFQDKTVMDKCIQVLFPSVESSSPASPAAELVSKPPTKVVKSQPTADKENLKEVEPSIRAALQKIRFLSLTATQFAEGPARSGLLTKDETLAVLMNMASRDSAVPMPTGFSECRERRQPRSDLHGDLEKKEQCFEAGSLEHTINALRCGDPSQVEDAARAAVRIMRTPLDMQPALDKGILDALVPALIEGGDECKQYAACAIYCLCLRGSPAQLRVVAASTALQPYCRLLPAGGAYTCNYVLRGLTDLLERFEQNAKPDLLQKLRALGLPQLLTTVRGGRFSLKEQCFEAGSLEHTINALRCGDPSQVEDAARAAADIMYNSTPLDIQPALDKGILDALVPALTEGSDKCKESATEAIYLLCLRGSPAQLRVLAASAALQPYCRLLPAAGAYTCTYVLCGLTDLLERVEQNAKPHLLQKLRALGVPQLLTTVRGVGHSLNRELANNLLQMYFHNDQ